MGQPVNDFDSEAFVTSSGLRGRVEDVLKMVAAGTVVTVTADGVPVAEIAPVRSRRSQFLTRADLVHLLAAHQADAGLAADLDEIAGETTADLDPL